MVLLFLDDLERTGFRQVTRSTARNRAGQHHAITADQIRSLPLEIDLHGILGRGLCGADPKNKAGPKPDTSPPVHDVLGRRSSPKNSYRDRRLDRGMRVVVG